ncbi:MAG: ATP synthase subunit b [Melioribacteraceae bacterium]|nr:MAG: ATP synthase subunit b [Melioribacteraceae bacterium]
MSFINNLAAMVLAAGGGNGGLLDVNPGLIFWTVITFILLLLILKKLAWKPILTSLSEREQFIEESLKKAETAKADAEKMMQDNKAAIDAADDKAREIIDSAKKEAEALRVKNEEKVKLETQAMIDAAKAEIERKNQEAFVKLKEQVAEIAVDAAEKIVRSSLDKGKQIELVNQYIDDLSKN